LASCGSRASATKACAWTTLLYGRPAIGICQPGCRWNAPPPELGRYVIEKCLWYKAPELRTDRAGLQQRGKG